MTGGRFPVGGPHAILLHFELAHSSLHHSTGSTDRTFELITLVGRRVELLSKMQRFRDQGQLMCSFASGLRLPARIAGWFQKARDVGAAHGFFSVECGACLGLKWLAVDEGRQEEGLELVRNSLAASPLCDLRENEENGKSLSCSRWSKRSSRQPQSTRWSLSSRAIERRP